MHRYVLHNREVRDARDALLSPGQVGFLNGWGVFSTLRVSKGVLFAFERHYARLRRDANLLHVPFSITAEQLQSALQALVDANCAYDAVLRVALIRNRGGLFEGPELVNDFDIVAFTANLNDWGAAARLTYVPNARFAASPFAGTKTTSWAQNLTWYEEVHQKGFDEAVLLDEHGRVSECTSANIFAIEGRKVYTPPVRSTGCLPGITRAILLEEIHVDGVEVSEREMSPSELESSESVFITSSTRDLLPIVSIDRASFPIEHPVLSLLRNAFLEYRNKYVAEVLNRRSLVYS